jgi:phage terminase large subunit-like protein
LRAARAFVYSAAAAEKLRGPEHHFAWADELAKWEQADAALDNLMMGMRLGDAPKVVVTTTPRGVAALRRLRRMPGVVETGGATADNRHLPGAFKAWVEETYGGTRLGRQELEGMLFDEPEGALFPRTLLEGARQSGVLPREWVVEGRAAEALPYLKRHPGQDRGCAGDPFWRRVVVGVDPPASAGGDACGIVVCGLGGDGVAYVLADCTVRGKSPEGWARAVARAAAEWGADRVVAEKNQGGDMVMSVLHGVDEALPVRLVSASQGKVARAEPVAARMERGKVKLAGTFPALEDELAGLQLGGGYEGPGRSPDRADACVWALAALIGSAGEPRVVTL